MQNSGALSIETLARPDSHCGCLKWQEQQAGRDAFSFTLTAFRIASFVTAWDQARGALPVPAVMNSLTEDRGLNLSRLSNIH